MRKYLIPVLTVSIGMALFTAGSSVSGPILPGFLGGFGLSLSAVGLMISLSSAAAMVLAFPSGLLTDRFRPKPVIVSGMVLLTLGALALYAAQGVAALFAAQVLIGGGTAFVTTASMSQLLDLVDAGNRSKASGLYMLFNSVPSVLGSALGGQIAYRGGDRAAFLTYAGLAGLGAVLSAIFVRSTPARSRIETPQSVAAPAPGGWRAGLLALRPLLAVYMVHFGYMLCFQGLIGTALPLFVGELGMDSRVAGNLVAVAGLASMLCLYPAGILADSLGRREVMLPTALLGWAALVALRLSSTAAMLTLGAVLVGISAGSGMPLPAVLVGDLAPPESRGKAMGAYRFVGQLGATLSGLLFGAVGEVVGLANSFLFALAIWIVITAVIFRLPRGRPGRSAAAWQ